MTAAVAIHPAMIADICERVDRHERKVADLAARAWLATATLRLCASWLWGQHRSDDPAQRRLSFRHTANFGRAWDAAASLPDRGRVLANAADGLVEQANASDEWKDELRLTLEMFLTNMQRAMDDD